MELILASRSRDRKKLFDSIQVPVKIMPTDFDERSIHNENPYTQVEQIALGKAQKLLNELKSKQYQSSEAIIVAADTMGLINDKLIGKAKDFDHAKQILSELSGKIHTLITGVALIEIKTERSRVFHEVSYVKFHNLSEQEIIDYLTITNEYIGRAGAYSMRERASLFVEKVEGCPTNVLGLPMARLRIELKEMGFNLLTFQ